MSYQGGVWGTLRAYCASPDQLEPVLEFLNKHPKLKNWEHRIEASDDTIIDLTFSGEIRYYFREYLESVAHDLVALFPGAYMKGALSMYAENDVPYRLEMYEDGSTECSDECDWVLLYSCKDIKRIQKWAEANCKEVGI